MYYVDRLKVVDMLTDIRLTLKLRGTLMQQVSK